MGFSLDNTFLIPKWVKLVITDVKIYQKRRYKGKLQLNGSWEGEEAVCLMAYSLFILTFTLISRLSTNSYSKSVY